MAKKPTDILTIDTIRLEGALFVPDHLEKIIRGEHTHQKGDDYRIPKGLKLHEEYGRAFQIARAQWQSFVSFMGREDVDPFHATRSFITELLRDALGFTDIEQKAPVTLGQYRYPLTAIAKGLVPVVIAPHTLDLDEPDHRFAIEGSGSRKKSAARLAQLFLDASPECAWAIVGNGKRLRLIRDTASLTRPTFLEFDLETMLSENRYPDFAALWRIIHESRAGEKTASGDACIWELWREEGCYQGTRIREGLRHGVTQALITLGQGFLRHPLNESLRNNLFKGLLTKDAYFQELLRLIYRFLFVFTVEERGMLHTETPGKETLAAKKIYAEGYAFRRLRDRSLRRSGADTHEDLWQAVRIVFKGLENGEQRLALPALGGLFSPEQCPTIDTCALENRALLSAMRDLRWSVTDSGLSPVDYKNMGSEELGSVYESLLELVPHIDLSARHFGFVGVTDSGLTNGHARKTTGSYYTPDSLVKELIQSALDPVIERHVNEHPENPVDALLNISVIDPACGSGHFLLAAARRLAERLSDLKSQDGLVKPADYHHALREVIARCIYGVDKNPLALELSRTTLWLEGFAPDRALSFLDHHLVCGDALLGVIDFSQLSKGIPDEAYKALSGDDRKVCADLLAENKPFRKRMENRKEERLFRSAEYDDALETLSRIEAMPDETSSGAREKERAYRDFLEQAKESPLSNAADLFTGAFLIPKNDRAGRVPTTRHLMAELYNDPRDPGHPERLSEAKRHCREARVLHYPLTFPKIFAKGGFECVLGNPPWERIKLQEQEFFATRNPDIATAKNKAERDQRIAWLAQGVLAGKLMPGSAESEAEGASEKRLYDEFILERRRSEAVSLFTHLKETEGGRYPLTGTGDVNTYALFAETNHRITRNLGRAGFIVPTGVATDDSTKAFFAHVTTTQSLVSFFDFENRNAIFPGVHRSYKFCLMTLGKSREAHFAFFLTHPDQLNDTERRFALTPSDFARINPNTLTCPVFRSRMDAELTKKIYERVPVLIQEGEGKKPAVNPWGISFSAMFHMSNDSHLFKNSQSGNTLPLYEAKMVHQFDHRWAGYQIDGTGNPAACDISLTEKENPHFSVRPRYWVETRQVIARIASAPRLLCRAYAAGDEAGLLKGFANWIDAGRKGKVLETEGDIREAVIRLGGPIFKALPAPLSQWQDKKVRTEMLACPKLDGPHLELLRNAKDIWAAADTILDQRSPRWLMGWRDICRATDERTVIASVMPRVGVNHKLPIIKNSDKINTKFSALLLSNFNSIVFDYVARQKVSGTSLTYFYLKQFPVIPPDHYSKKDIVYIIPRILELTYTTHDLKPWAEELGYTGPPFGFDPERRAVIRAELDAWYAKLYGLSRDELRYILDPADVMGTDYPSESFRVLKNNEERAFGEYRTGRLVLACYDALACSEPSAIAEKIPEEGDTHG